MTVIDATAVAREALARRAGLRSSAVTDDLAIADLGIDSIGLIEVLLDVIPDGAGVDEADNGALELPWIESVGDLMRFVADISCSSKPGEGRTR